MANQFKDLQVHDDSPDLTKEEALKRTLGFSGIHDFEVDDLIHETFGGSTLASCNMDHDEGTVWTVSNGVLNGAGDGAARWWRTYHDTEVPIGFVATFDKTGNRGGFFFCSDTSFNSYMAWWDGTVVGFVEVAGTTVTELSRLPMAETGAAAVTVAVWPRMYTAIDEIDDIVMALWFDDQLLLTYTIKYDPKGEYVGFACYDSDTMTIDNLRVPQIHQIQEWTSVDPGEPASASMSRIIGRDLIRCQARYNGAVKIWRNTTTTSDWTMAQSRPLEVSKEHRYYSPSHFRLVGALHEIDAFRLNEQGHIFEVGQDPNALSEDETYDQAGRLHERIAEESTQLTIRNALNPVLEPEDIVTLDADTWRVTAIQYRVFWGGGMGGRAPILESTINAREAL